MKNIRVDKRGFWKGLSILVILLILISTSHFTAFAEIHPPLIGRVTYDFGDAPDPTYPSLLASNGTRHTNTTGAWFGVGVSAEPDSRQIDADTFDDGLIETTPLTFVVTNNDWPGPLFVNVLADLNGDGDWNDSDEWVLRNMQVNVSMGQSQVFETTITIMPNFELRLEHYWRYIGGYVAIRAPGGPGASVLVRERVGLHTIAPYVGGLLPHGTVVTTWVDAIEDYRFTPPDHHTIWKSVTPCPHMSPGQNATGFVKLSELSGPPLQTLINAGIVPRRADAIITRPTRLLSCYPIEGRFVVPPGVYYLFPPVDYKKPWDRAFWPTADPYKNFYSDFPVISSNTPVTVLSGGDFVIVKGLYREFSGYVDADDVELLPGREWEMFRLYYRKGYLRMTLTAEPLSNYTGTGAFGIGETEDYALPPPRLYYYPDDPPSVEQGQTAVLSIIGENFVEGIEVGFAPSTGIRTEKVIYKSPLWLEAVINIDTNAPVGWRDIIVINPDGQTATLKGGFTVGDMEERPEIQQIVDWYNANINQIPDVIKTIMGTETIRANITFKDGSIAVIGLKTEKGLITEVSKEPYPDSTMALYISEKTVEKIGASEDRLGALLAAWGRDIRWEGLTIGANLKTFTTSVCVNMYRIFKPSPFDIKPDEAKSIKYKGEQATLKLNPKGVPIVEFIDKEKVIVVDKYGAELGNSTKPIQKLLQADPIGLSKNAGIYTALVLVDKVPKYKEPERRGNRSERCDYRSEELLRTVVSPWRVKEKIIREFPRPGRETFFVVTIIWERDIANEWKIFECTLKKGHEGGHHGPGWIEYRVSTTVTQEKQYYPGDIVKPPEHYTDGLPEVDFDEKQKAGRARVVR